jgi:predicted 2-oxoglutarate/Fe(II)-dependent dioxygenase YbiX
MFFDIRKIKHHKQPLDLDKIKSVLAHANRATKECATVGKIINGKYTTEYDKWCTASFVNYTDFAQDVEHIKDSVKKIIEKDYKVLCLESEIHFLHYKDGAQYKSHIDGQYIEDGTAKRGVDRDITAVVYLNDDYNGGEIFFDFFDVSYKPNRGDVLIYPTTFQYKHGVSEVKGDRYAIVFWFKTNPEINVDIKILDNRILNFLKD